MDTRPSARPTDADSETSHVHPARGIWPEVRWFAGLLGLLLLCQSLITKPFYIPSVSMMPTLLNGDHLMVSKYPYGWSWASAVPRIVPRMPGRLLGSLPQRGDVVIVTHPGQRSDYIKRVIGLPGETIEVRRGQVVIDGRPVPRTPRPATMIPIDANVSCTEGREKGHAALVRGVAYCRLPVFRETLPNGRTYDTIDLGYQPVIDDYGPVRIPAGHVFLMGDNRDQSADSRVPLSYEGLGGPVPVENVGGRAEVITFSMTGDLRVFHPSTWGKATRGDRSWTTLRPATKK